MIAPVLLDASAVLAWLRHEPGADIIDALLEAATPPLVSAANHGEIIAKLLDRGMDGETLRNILAAIGYSVIPVSVEDGDGSGWLRHDTRVLGLSLGDRVCLATAQRLKAQVYTADRAWCQLATRLQLDIYCIRPES